MKSNNQTWIPNEEVVNDIHDELVVAFKEGEKSDLLNPIFADLDQNITGLKPTPMPDSDFLIACAKIGAFLMDEKAVTAQLIRLNELLKIKLQTSNNDQNILRDILEEELGKLGFHPHFGKTLDNVKPEIFRATIASGLLLKDASLGALEHGEYPHLIQWLIIAWQQDDINFIGKPAIEIFKQMGNETSVYYRSPLTKEDATNPDFVRSEKSMWDLIVDTSVYDKKLFRSPEILNDFLINSKEENLSILKKLIRKRKGKRLVDEAFDKFNLKYKTATEPKKDADQQVSAHTFLRKNNKISYRSGNLENVLEPSDIKVDVEALRKK